MNAANDLGYSFVSARLGHDLGELIEADLELKLLRPLLLAGLTGAAFALTLSLADRVAEAQPPRQRTSAGGISPVGAAVLSDTGGTRGGWV